ncbi:MAG: hypothetical protein AAGA28_17540 [Pseudomonadota bacterium]
MTGNRHVWRWTMGLILALSGCTPVSVYYQEGAEVSRIDSALTQCRVTALELVPVNERRRYIPPTYTYRNYCSAPGACYTRRILINPGYWETYDANEGLRAEATQTCMSGSGFGRVSLPQCSPEVVERTTITRTRVQPPITDKSCIIRIRGGSYQIVTP